VRGRRDRRTQAIVIGVIVAAIVAWVTLTVTRGR
jgi:hypothetical protein